MIEIGVAIIASVFIFFLDQNITSNQKEIKALKERVEKLEESLSKEDDKS